MTPQRAEMRHHQRQAGQQLRLGSALLALVALAAAGLPCAEAVKGLSPWSSGLITHYGGAQDGELGGRVAVRCGRRAGAQVRLQRLISACAAT